MNANLTDNVAAATIDEASIQHFVVHIDPETGAETRIPVDVTGTVQDVEYSDTGTTH